MKKILTYNDMINLSMNDIENIIINQSFNYSYNEVYQIRKIFDIIANKFNEYESQVEKINESLILIDKDKKIIDLFNYYENIIREWNNSFK